jgi:hypothetical protein
MSDDNVGFVRLSQDTVSKSITLFKTATRYAEHEARVIKMTPEEAWELGQKLCNMSTRAINQRFIRQVQHAS